MKMILRFLATTVLVGTIGMLGYHYFTYNNDFLNVDTTGVYLLSVNNDYKIYEIIDTNKVRCDLNTVSYIYNKMLSEGYVIEEDLSTDDYIDIIIGSNSAYIRMRYEEGNLTTIAKPYEYSGLPLTYLE